MGPAHIINGAETGKENGRETFPSLMKFSDYPEKVELPRLTKQDCHAVLTAMDEAYRIPARERRRLVRSLGNYRPSQKTIEGMCLMTGMPISWVRERVYEGIQMAQQIAELDAREGLSVVVAGITPNDPREVPFFMAHFLMAGTPATIKLSSREPFLGNEMLIFLYSRGLPKGYLNIIYADSSNPDERGMFKALLESPGIVPIVMGAAYISPNQISFYAEHSRGLVLDAAKAVPHLRPSVESPNSCLAEHNYIVVGKDNYKKVVTELRKIYSSLRPGNLLDERTTLGRIDPEVIKQAHDNIRHCIYNGSAGIAGPDPRKPSRRPITTEDVAEGLVIQNLTQPDANSPNPLTWQPLPFYVTVVTYARTVEEALAHMQFAGTRIEGGKCMAIGIYDSAPPAHLYEAQRHAYEVCVNSSPVNKPNGAATHQGINIGLALTEQRQMEMAR